MDEREERRPFALAEPPDADGPNPPAPESDISTGTITAAETVTRCSTYDQQSARLRRLLANLDTNPARDIQVRQGLKVRWIYHTYAEAALTIASGPPSNPPCYQCARDQGPFTECMVISGEALGSCANCHYGMRGNCCSFRSVEVRSSPQVWSSPAAATPAPIGTRYPARAASIAPNMGLRTSASHVPAAAAWPRGCQSSSPFTDFDSHATVSECLPTTKTTAAQLSQPLADSVNNATESGLASATGSSTARPTPASTFFDAHTTGRRPTDDPAAVAMEAMAGWSPRRLRRTGRDVRPIAENYETLADL